jgi:hypothetical protein
MKSISLFTIIAILGSLSGSAQDAAPPPVAGFAPVPSARTPGDAAAAPAAAPAAPAAASAEDPGNETTGGTETIGTAAEVDQPEAAASKEGPKVAATETSDENQSASTAPGTPAETAPPGGETPPGPGGDTGKVDFLQRSNLILARLLENERPMDPFGLVMDPANAKAAPVLADQYEEVEETPQLNSSSLKNALLTLPITGIYPKRGMIVLGARTFEVGGQFGMKLQDLTIRLRFEGIRDGEIFFKDMETREVTSIPFNPRPAEFEPIAKGAKREPGQGISAMNDLFIAN